MRGKRFFLFLLMIGLGALLGLIYGWIIHPLGGGDSTIQVLRYDYHADYVLMVAEIYAADGDLEQASARLTQAGDQPPASIAAGALEAARSLEWATSDLEKLENLTAALQGEQPREVQPEQTPTGTLEGQP